MAECFVDSLIFFHCVSSLNLDPHQTYTHQENPAVSINVKGTYLHFG